VDGRLRILFREEHLPCRETLFAKDWMEYFSGWNRRTGSRLSRTLVVRKAGN
jgi:hypothetical protein